MGVTQPQLEGVQKFAWGAATHRVVSWSSRGAIERSGEGHDRFMRHEITIESELDGSDLADLAVKVAALQAAVATSGQNFTLYRKDTAVYELLATDCHHGPIAALELTALDQSGARQSFRITVTAQKPISVAAGVIDHVYTDSEVTEKVENQLVTSSRRGEVVTIAGTSARTWIEANLPAPIVGFDRIVTIDSDDTDTKVTYTVQDSLSERRNETASVRSHTYQYVETTVEGELREKRWRGAVTMKAGNGCRVFILANLPGTTAGFNRSTSVDTDDRDLVGAYTVIDTLSDYRNQTAEVKTHTYNFTEIYQKSILREKRWSGAVEMFDGSATTVHDFIAANLPGQDVGFVRNHNITNDDENLIGSYDVTDTKSGATNLPPGIEEARLETGEALDEHGRRLITKAGHFVGANAQTEVDNIRASLTKILSEDVTTDIYGDGRISFRFTAVDDESGGDGITRWREVVSSRGGGRIRVPSSYPDRNPFIYNAHTEALVIEVRGVAVSVTGAYVAPPAAPVGLENFQSGATDFDLNRLNEDELETTWRMTFICDPGTAVPKPRAPIVNFLP